MGKIGDKFISVPLNSLMVGRTAHVDLYLKLGEDRFVKVVRRGGNLDIEQLRNYDQKHVDEAWVTQEEYKEHVQHNLEVNKAIQKMFAGKTEWQYRSIQSAAESVFLELSLLQIDEESLGRAAEICVSAAATVSQLSVDSLIKALAEMGEDYTRHSMAVSAFSVMISDALGWKSPKTLKIIGLGGLLHDIGMREMPQLVSKARIDMTPEEVKLYESHPQRGADLLRDFRGIPGEVCALIYDHHERPNGVGFPRALTRERIFPLSRVVALADSIAHAVIKTKRDPEVTPLPEAITRLKLVYQHDFEASFWAALGKLGKTKDE